MSNKTTVTAEPGKQELFISREFDAPRELVFKAHTDPDLYVQWVGPHGMSMEIEKWECYEGGSYRFTHERDGHKYAFFGVNHEVLAVRRPAGTRPRHSRYDQIRRAARRPDADHPPICFQVG